MQTDNTKKTVLIVDDIPENIDLLSGILNRDYHVKVALNGQKALSIAESENPPDLILLDIMMPEIDGYQVCRKLKESADTCDIPVLFVTAMDEVTDEARGLALGAVDYITKPVSPPIVLARVKTHMDLKMHRDNFREALSISEKKLSDISNQTEQLSLSAASMITIKDEKEFFNKISKAIVDYSDFKRVIISLFKKEPPYRDIIAFGGVESETLNDLRKAEMPKSWYDNVFLDENIVGQYSYYIPHTKKDILHPNTLYGSGIVSDDTKKWHPEDNLFVRMNDKTGNTIGVISVDESKSGLIPSPETVRPLEIFSSLISQIVILKNEQEERRNIEIQLRQTQKMEAIGTLAGGIAHDFNNILSGILGYAELIQEDLDDCMPVTRERMKRVIKASLRGRDLVNQILAFSQSDQRDLILIQVDLIIKEVLELIRASLPSSIRIEHLLESDSYIIADPISIHQIILNLCTNAKDAMNETGGILSITLEDINLKSDDVDKYEGVLPGHFLRITVKDTGCGMKSEVMNRVLEPFFTTKPPGKGTGMGLSVVHGIVKSLRGFIQISSTPEKGTSFHICLPAREKKPGTNHVSLKEIENCEGDEKILFIDDEKILTEMTRDTLENFGYHVTIFSDSQKTLEHFKKHPDNYDLVISDTTMPDMTGDMLIRRSRLIRPDSRIFLLFCVPASVNILTMKQSGRCRSMPCCTNQYLLKT